MVDMNSAADIAVVRTSLRVANHATGEAHPRHEVILRCACPSCGDVDAHAGNSYRGTATIQCGWCGHSWTLAHA